MALFKNLAKLLALLPILTHLSASVRGDNSPDQHFLDLGTTCPYVGCFELPYAQVGSGVLVSLQGISVNPLLENRVVITAAHNFEEYLYGNKKPIKFTLDGLGESYGVPLIHEGYTKNFYQFGGVMAVI